MDDIVASGVCPFFGGMGFLRGNRSSSLAFDLSRPFWPMELDEKCCVSLSSVSSIQCKLMESKAAASTAQVVTFRLTGLTGLVLEYGLNAVSIWLCKEEEDLSSAALFDFPQPELCSV